MSDSGEPSGNDIQGSPESRNDDFERFESLVRKVMTTPKPASAPVDSAGEPSGDGSERERED